MSSRPCVLPHSFYVFVHQSEQLAPSLNRALSFFENTVHLQFVSKLHLFPIFLDTAVTKRYQPQVSTQPLCPGMTTHPSQWEAQVRVVVAHALISTRFLRMCLTLPLARFLLPLTSVSSYLCPDRLFWIGCVVVVFHLTRHQELACLTRVNGA